MLGGCLGVVVAGAAFASGPKSAVGASQKSGG